MHYSHYKFSHYLKVNRLSKLYTIYLTIKELLIINFGVENKLTIMYLVF